MEKTNKKYLDEVAYNYGRFLLEDLEEVEYKDLTFDKETLKKVIEWFNLVIESNTNLIIYATSVDVADKLFYIIFNRQAIDDIDCMILDTGVGKRGFHFGYATKIDVVVAMTRDIATISVLRK